MIIKVPKDKIEFLKTSLVTDKIEKTVVGAIIVSQDWKVLLLRRIADDFMGGLVEIPSGGVDGGEDLLEALSREVKEETGLNISRVISYTGSFDYISGSGKKSRQLNFLVCAEGDIKLNPRDHDFYYIISPDDEAFNKLNISP